MTIPLHGTGSFGGSYQINISKLITETKEAMKAYEKKVNLK